MSEPSEGQPNKGLYAQLDRIAKKQDELSEQFAAFRVETAGNRAETNERLKALEIDIRAIKHDAQAYVSNRALLAGVITGLASFGIVAYIMFQAAFR